MSAFIGVDISAKTFDLVVRKQDKSSKSICLLRLLKGIVNALICLKNSNFKQFAELMLTQSKTDSIDAKLLAEFAQKIQPRLWVAPSNQCLALKDLGR